MKFFAKPNMYVTDFRTKQYVCKFNDKGELVTNDEKLIERLKPHFKYEEEKPRKRR